MMRQSSGAYTADILVVSHFQILLVSTGIRLYLSYQNFKVHCKIGGSESDCNLLSFLHDNHSYQNLFIQDSIISLDSARNKGEWFLEADSAGSGMVLHGKIDHITAPNALCGIFPDQSDMRYVLTCPISSGISFYNNETKSLKLSISMKNSFEWIEHSDPAYFEPLNGDTIYDFGLRGLKVVQ